MSDYDSTADTEAHIRRVAEMLNDIADDLRQRAEIHDASKLVEPEKSAFDKYTPLLSQLTYMSDEYKAALDGMRPAIEHHYKHNRHHPEYHPRGVRSMNLMDIIEMLVDWKAAGERHSDGDILRSIELNMDRLDFGIELSRIMINTAVELGWIK